MTVLTGLRGRGKRCMIANITLRALFSSSLHHNRVPFSGHPKTESHRHTTDIIALLLLSIGPKNKIIKKYQGDEEKVENGKNKI